MFEAKPYTGKTAFEQRVEYEGVPMIRDFIVPDLNTNGSGTEPVRYVAGVPHIHTGVYAKRIGLQQKQSAIASAMRALRDGAVYMKANKAGSIQVIQKISKLNDKQVAERSYDILKEDVVTDPRIPAEVIQQSIKLAARSDDRVKNVDISKAVDLGVANRIMESGK